MLIRPQIPHVGRVLLSEEQINVNRATSTELHLTVEREEDFAGTVAFEVRGLPAGISAGSGMANPVEKPPLPNAKAGTVHPEGADIRAAADRSYGYATNGTTCFNPNLRATCNRRQVG